MAVIPLQSPLVLVPLTVAVSYTTEYAALALLLFKPTLCCWGSRVLRWRMGIRLTVPELLNYSCYCPSLACLPVFLSAVHLLHLLRD